LSFKGQDGLLKILYISVCLTSSWMYKNLDRIGNELQLSPLCVAYGLLHV